MSRVAYVNGRYVRHSQAGVSIEDRGYQFADGVYEVIEVWGGRLVDEEPHIARLRFSLAELKIAHPLTEQALRLVIRETVRRNRVRDGMAYVQVTRGVARREHVFPDQSIQPGIVVTARSIDAAAGHAKAERGVRVITVPDLRWRRPDIKSISLLPNVLARQEAKVRGAAEAWLINDEGLITEGAASNAWIIDGAGRVVTHPVTQTILNGVTRTTLLKMLRERALRVEERPFSPGEAYAAKEAFVTGATTLVMPVVAIDDHMVDDGRPGPIVAELRLGFHSAARLSLA